MRYLFNGFALDTDRRELRHGPTPASVAPQVFDLLAYLIKNRERVVSKDDLFSDIWHGRIVSDSALNTRINAARCAIGDTGEEQRLIRTFPRKGLRFIGAVKEEPTPAPPQQLDVPITRQLPSPVIALPDRPSIAVLPFASKSGESEQDYFADGLAEEITTALSRCPRLFVTARNSSFAYKGKAVDVRQIGRELGVRYLLDGSVRREADRLRFIGYLIDATSGGHLWADRFEGSSANVFDLQDRFTENVVAAIEPRLQLAEIERLKRKPASDLEPSDLLLRAQQCEYQFRREGHDQALSYLKQALDLDASYAPAMALAALCHTQRRDQSWMKNFESESREGIRLASRAVELGKDDANVFWMSGYALVRLGTDLQLAKELVDHSLELNPHSAIASAIAGELAYITGNNCEALDLLSRALRLSPRDPREWLIRTNMAWLHLTAGRLDQAIVSAKRVLSRNPHSAYVLRMLAASLAKQGQLKHAAETIREVLKIEPQLNLTKLRSRLLFIEDKVWDEYSAALHLAGLPE